MRSCCPSFYLFAESALAAWPGETMVAEQVAMGISQPQPSSAGGGEDPMGHFYLWFTAHSSFPVPSPEVLDKMVSEHGEDFTVQEAQSRVFRDMFWAPIPASSIC